MNTSRLQNMLRSRKYHRKWMLVFLILAVLVSTGVGAALHRTGIAAVYTKHVLDCPYAELSGQVAHIHTTDCYAEDGTTLVCPLQEIQAHVHTEDCYSELLTLTCILEENPGHMHDESCYTLTRGDLLCTDESEEHEHTDACYEMVPVLSCGMQDGEGAHTHDDACYDIQQIITCGIQELPEHVHDAACFKAVELTEDEMAALGIASESPSEVSDAQDGDGNEPADASSGITAEDAAEIPEDENRTEEIPAEAGIADTQTDGEDNESTDYDEDNEVNETDENSNSSEIIDDKDNAEEEDAAAEETGADVAMPAISFEETAGDVRVIVEADEGVFPEGTTMTVEEVVDEEILGAVSEAVNGRVEQVKAVDITFKNAEGEEIQPAKPIRVRMEPLDGSEINAAAESAKAAENEDFQVVHVDADGKGEIVEQPEELTTEEAIIAEENNATFFDAEHFSVYAMVHSIHFEYEVNGDVYTSEAAGAEDILLSDIIGDLNIVPQEEIGIFLSKISNVAITDPEVLKITEGEGDWIIRSIKNAENPESLQITMQDGAMFSIQVAAEGITEVSTTDETAVISTVNDFYLPEKTAAYADLLDEKTSEAAITTVQNLEEQELLRQSAQEGSDLESGYLAFDIGLENVDAETYPDGFEVTLKLPEGLTGRDFRLFHIHNGNVDVLELNTEMATLEDGTKQLSSVHFVTPSFSEFVLSYRQITQTIVTASGDTYEITVLYDETAEIPDGAKLQVREILPEDEEYADYFERAKEATTPDFLKSGAEENEEDALNADSGNSGSMADEADAVGEESADQAKIAEEYGRFFDIEIWADGKKIEPESNVSVTIKLLDVPQENTALRVVHFSTDGPEIIDVEENKEKAGETELAFVTDEFSVYAVIEDVDHGEPDLANRTVKISVGGNYLTNQNNYDESPWRIEKTNNINQAADFQFEETSTPGVYRVYTMVNGQRNYLHINHHTGNPHSDNGDSACVNITGPEYTMDLNIVQNGDGTYGIYRNIGGTNYYLNQFGGAGGTGFAAYADADGGGNSKLTFSSNDSSALQSGTHIMLAKIDEYYYIVNNDGTLTSVEYIEATNQVKVENPMMWTYTGSNLYHNSDAVDFDGSMVASDFYHKYIDPSVGSGISVDTSENTQREIAGWKDTDGDGTYETPYYRIVNGSRQMQFQSALTYVNKHLVSNNGEYYIGVTEENGVLKLAGTQDSSHAVEILFASPTSVLPVDSRNHTVSHIDISIEGTSEVDVPLAYGKYYDADGNEILEVSTNKSIKLSKEGIGISTDDMKKATIIAYTKNASGQAVPIDNAFYITGYSANAATEYSTPQVRIEGSFKVANLNPEDQDWNHRLNNKIYYSVTAIKNVTFDLVDPDLGQLYDAEGNKLTISIDVAFSASFDYWDERNECPPVKWNLVNWRRGDIPGGSGMDFVLGGDAEQAESNIVAIEITKLVVDEDGHRINPSTSTPVNNTFEIYQDADGDPDSVIGMGIDGRPIDVNYTDYINLHSKSIRVGADGIGLVYDYDVTPGMYFIREDPGSVLENIVDAEAKSWEYVGTRIETESPWRDDPNNDGKMHTSEIYSKPSGSYNSVPEVLGNYTDIHGNATWYDSEEGKEKPVRNGFLEFYVYNIYRPVETNITLKKVDKDKLNEENPDLLKGASFTITKYADENFQGKDTTWGTSGSMTVSDDKKPDGTYTLNGLFAFEGLTAGYYQIEETRFPDGYIKISGNPRFEVKENTNHELEITLINNPDNLLRLEGNNLTIVVGNTPGVALPMTGGSGTVIFTALGGLMILTGGTFLALISYQRKKKESA